MSIQVTDLLKTFAGGSVRAVDEINFSVPTGSVLMFNNVDPQGNPPGTPVLLTPPRVIVTSHTISCRILRQLSFKHGFKEHFH